MNYEKVGDDLIAAAKVDADYQLALESVKSREECYVEVCSSLTDEQRTVIEEYIAACEELGDCMTWIAYRLGKCSCTS